MTVFYSGNRKHSKGLKQTFKLQRNTYYFSMAEPNEQDNECNNRFNIQLVFSSFTKCSEDTDALQMDQYLIGFKELYKFFCLLGSVFSFVASDIISKVDILEKYRQSSKGEAYLTIQSMIDHEIANNCTVDPNKPSGSRTLLRLHRALEFIMFFMRELSTSEMSVKSSAVARKCYQDSLAKYHPFVIRWTAMAAMSTLPEKKQLMKTIFGHCDDDTVKHCETLMGDIAEMSRTVYDATQKIYETNQLLDLP